MRNECEYEEEEKMLSFSLTQRNVVASRIVVVGFGSASHQNHISFVSFQQVSHAT